MSPKQPQRRECWAIRRNRTNDHIAIALREGQTLLDRLGLSYDQLLGIRFAVNVLYATTIVWFTMRQVGDSNPIWAIASLVAASDPEPNQARQLFRSRMINVLVGCAVGFCFLLFGSRSRWMIPLALGTTVLVSTYLVRVKTMWRQAPITRPSSSPLVSPAHRRKLGWSAVCTESPK